MIIDTEIIYNSSHKLMEKYGRSIVVRAEKFALEQANIYRPLTDPWITCFLREREVFCKLIFIKE